MYNLEKYLFTAGCRIVCLRCTALSKNTRQQCGRPALKTSTTQKCQFHGGRGSGPKTAAGKARIGASHFVHGNETKQIRQERSRGALRLAQIENLMHTAGMTTEARTTGRKPAGYRPINTLEEARRLVVEDALQRVKGLPEAD